MEISLALGGGGAKGVAHLGVLRLLEKESVQVKAVAGTSAGGIVAAIYAAGYSPDEMLRKFQQVDRMRLFSRQPGDGPSLLGVAGINQVLKEMLGESTFDELKIPLAVTAVDLKTGREIIIKHGRVIEAVLATISLPGIFPPRELLGHLLVDGGMVDPVPVAPARSLAPKLPVVAVVLSGSPLRPMETLEPPALVKNVPLLSQIARLRVAQSFNVFVHSLEISSRYFAELRLKLDKPDVIIRPEVSHIGLFDLADIDEVADEGERAAKKKLPEIRETQNWRRRLSRNLRAPYLVPFEGLR